MCAVRCMAHMLFFQNREPPGRPILHPRITHMIVILGSRYDAVAEALVRAWPHAALCSAEDLLRPGWCYHPGSADGLRWVVDGSVVPDPEVTGVYVCRNAVHAEELMQVHPDDRAYLAAETHALLVALLASTQARVVNPVFEGVFGHDTLRPERWMRLAAGLGINVCPRRVSSEQMEAWPGDIATIVTVLGQRVWSGTAGTVQNASRSLVAAAGMVYGRVAFDREGRFVAVSFEAAPTDESCSALGCYLAGAPL
jgi:hypothetical protein